MSAAQRESGLPAFPDGWYCIGESRDFASGKALPVRLAGHDLVVFRTAAGALTALDATCPHLGADLSRGGTVLGDCVRCPFHGFEFDASGTCVRTAYGTKPPPRAVVRPWPVRELDGLVLAFVDSRGLAPTWTPPEADRTGFSRLRTAAFELASHPQETTENSVDFGHLRVVHGYEAVTELAPLELAGPHLRSRYRIVRPRGLFRRGGAKVAAELDIHVWGLGFSRVEVWLADLGLRTRLWVLPRPTDVGRVTLRIGVQVRREGPKSKVHPALALLPAALVEALLTRATLAGLAADVRQDFAIWTHKRYVHPPALAEGDGPIGSYRRWARQFYPETEPTRLPVVAAG